MKRNSLIKKAHKLNFTIIFPNNFEKQKVSLVENFFHETTIVGLQDLMIQQIVNLPPLKNLRDVMSILVLYMVAVIMYPRGMF